MAEIKNRLLGQVIVINLPSQEESEPEEFVLRRIWDEEQRLASSPQLPSQPRERLALAESPRRVRFNRD